MPVLSRITPLEKWISSGINSGSGYLNPPDLESYHLRMLRENVKYVSEMSPFYRKLFTSYPWEGIDSLYAFSTLPFTTADDIKRCVPQMLCVSQDEINRVVTLDSSGTTGEAKRIYFTEEDQELTVDFFMHGMSVLTETGDRVLILLPCERAGSVGDLLASAVERLGAVPFRHGVVTSVNAALNIIEAERINVIVGIPVQLLALARFHEEQGRIYAGIEKILLSTDNVSMAITAALEQIFGCEVYNHYGMTEMGLGGGIDCCAHGGYHLREADLFFEIIDPESGAVARDGEYGEVVFTTLTRKGMPLIRYRTGDISRFLPGKCGCGTSLRRMDYIRGRISGLLPLSDSGFLTMSDLDEAIFSLRGVVDFKASAKTGGRSVLELDIITISSAIGGEDVADSISLIKNIGHLIETDMLDIYIKLSVCGDNYIPGAGKRSIKY